MKRQGDLLIIPVERVRGELSDSNIVLLGETSGHSHKIINGQVYRQWRDIYILANGDAELVHEEHDTVPLSAGAYKVIRQREYVAPGEESYIYD